MPLFRKCALRVGIWKSQGMKVYISTLLHRLRHQRIGDGLLLLAGLLQTGFELVAQRHQCINLCIDVVPESGGTSKFELFSILHLVVLFCWT